LGGLSVLSTAVTASEAVSVSALVAEISANNPERQFYRDEIAAAKAGARVSGRLADPELSFDVGHRRVKNPGGSLAGEGTAWSVSVTQTFDWPGRLSLRKAIANRDVELAGLGLARFENALAARARTLAFGLHAANAKAAAVREVSDRFAALKETYLARDPAGVTPLLETRVIEASELTLQRRASEAQLALQAALIELNQLRGAALDAPLRVAAPTLTFNAIPDNAALLAAARENNFDYRMRRVELAQHGLSISLARNERHPAISVRPFVSSDDTEGRETTVGLGFSVPLPVNGRAAATVATAEARRRQAETSALVALRALDREVLTAALAFSTKLAESRRWTPDAAQKFREAAELADRHYRLGAVPVATYVEMQSAYLDATEALLDTRREAMDAGLLVQQLTGLDLNLVQIAQP
jgi:cobalt-zinc-cadmium efflux system outer membrane protein